MTSFLELTETTVYPFVSDQDLQAANQRDLLSDRFLQMGLRASAKKLLRCGERVVLVQRPEGRVPMPAGCRSGLCPLCTRHRRQRLFRFLHPQVQRRIGIEGSAAMVTFGLPPEDKSLRQRLDELSVTARAFAHTTAWRNTYRHQVGVILAFEISEGKGLGHAHFHAFLFGLDEAKVQEFTYWFETRLVQRPPESLLSPGSCREFSPEGPWAEALSYVLKGSAPQAGWSEALKRPCVELLTERRRMLSCFGLAKIPGGLFRLSRAA